MGELLYGGKNADASDYTDNHVSGTQAATISYFAEENDFPECMVVVHS